MNCPNCTTPMNYLNDNAGQYYCCPKCWTMADGNGVYNPPDLKWRITHTETDRITVAPVIDEPLPPRRKPEGIAEVWLAARGVIAGLGVHDTIGMRISARDFVQELSDYRKADRNQQRKASVTLLIDNLRAIE